MRRTENINSKLPCDIIHLLFSKLPFFNLPTCRLVCKHWNNLVLTGKFLPISNIYFIRTSPCENLRYIDFDPKRSLGMSIVASFTLHPNYNNIEFVNPCNGLLLFYKIRKSLDVRPVICVLNPMTSEYFQVPSWITDMSIEYHYGFGFSPKTKQYKIVRHSIVKQKCATLVEVFAFGTSPSKWTSVHYLPHVMDGHGVYFNGALYWIGRDLESADYIPKCRAKSTIFRFDVEDENFKEISCPEAGEFCSAIGVFNGNLYLSFYNWLEVEYHVWRMEGDSWIREFVVALPKDWILHHPKVILGTYPPRFRLIKVSEDGKILCLIHGLDLIFYDPKTRRVEAFQHVTRINEHLRVYQIESFNFHSLRKILVGEVEV